MPTESDFFGPAVREHPSSIPSNLAPGMRVADRYELSRKIGTGAMGEVWAAQHISLRDEVAIKLVLREAAHGDGSSADSRFLLEARVASQLSRKTRHVVSVTDHGADGPYSYLVMELLAGESLEVRLARTGPMPLAKVVPLVYQIARALSVAHADGVVHRDLKPSNVFVTADEDGRALIKILDFGIAKLRTSTRPACGTADEAKHTTQSGFLLGTPAYMSPEQARGKAIDHRADVWALGVITYHLLTGRLPFDGETPEDLFARLCRVEPTPISAWRPELPAVVGDLFARAFHERIDQRFQSAVAFAGALEHVESLQNCIAGAGPQAMGSISLPPADGDAPSVSPMLEASPPPETLESSLVAAGVPRKRSLLRGLVGAVVVLAVLIGTVSMLSMYFEREATRPVASAAAMTDIRRSQTRDEIAPPEPVTAPVLRPADLPAVLTVRTQAPKVVATPPPPPEMPTTMAVPADPPPPPERVVPPAKPAIDRSEVF
jgi:serine/threonine-protein kinase